ncbi:MAG: sensor domain-containing diguanylate cyclase [FCB group bacterium]|jgi:diguanylate cyclase (GGDEF)-like protein/PAS domain S-box-containing protein|nr:sensor domain-containing diguanylate cyclase [FCB group bacterium]
MLDPSMFKSLLDNLHEGVYYVDCTRQIQYWNKGAERISGFTAEEVVGKHCFDNVLIHVDGQGNSLCHGKSPLAATVEDGVERQTRVYLHHKDGHRVPVSVSIAPIRDANGKIVGGIEAFHDDTSVMSVLKQLEDLRQTADLCALTGTANRDYITRVLLQRLTELKERNETLAVLFIDVDHFKSVNDRFGHAVGDVVLKMVARTLLGAMRSYDCLGRWGGEEFVAVMPALKPIHLAETGERLRMLVETSSASITNGMACTTVSIGACMAWPEDTLTTLVARADQLMYESKNGGRNRVTVDTSRH